MESTDAEQRIWKSCCFVLDQRCVVFTVQTLLGIAMIIFCAYMLSTETNCDRAAPYWGLIGTISGFFFNRLSVTHYGVEVSPPATNTVTPVTPVPRRPLQPRVPNLQLNSNVV